MPLAPAGRTGPKVHSHIPHAAAQATHQLGLAVGRGLEMQPAHGTNNLRAAEIDLSNRPRSPGLRKRWLLGAKAIEESAAMVGERLAHKLQNAVDRGGMGFSRQGSNQIATGSCDFTGAARSRAMPAGSLMSRHSKVEPMNSSV